MSSETSARNLLAAMQALSKASARIDIALEIVRRLTVDIMPSFTVMRAELELVGRNLDEAKRLIGEP